MFQTDSFHLTYTTELYIEIFLRSANVRKAAGIVEISSHFLKDSPRYLLKPKNFKWTLQSLQSLKFSRPLQDCKVGTFIQKWLKTNHSTDPCLTSLYNKILKGFYIALMTDMILIDVQMAFDTTDHVILFKKLNAIIFSNHTIGWFKSDLSNRLFRVNLESYLFRAFKCCMWNTTRVYFSTFIFFSYTWMRFPKLLYQNCFYMLRTLALNFRKRML